MTVFIFSPHNNILFLSLKVIKILEIQVKFGSKLLQVIGFVNTQVELMKSFQPFGINRDMLFE